MIKNKEVIVLDRVSFSFRGRSILNDINLTINVGDFFALFGPSGAGKSTLLNIITGHLKPDRGKVFLMGENISELNRMQLASLRSQVGFLFQAGALFNGMSVMENVVFPLEYHHKLPKDIVEMLGLMKLEQVGLRNAKDLMPHQLSGGMSRRVALARAICMDPELMIYDEPFVGQDPVTVKVLVNLMKYLMKQEGSTSFMVTHDIKIALEMTNKIGVLHDGCWVYLGAPKAMKVQDDPWLAQFMGGETSGPIPFHYPGKTFEESIA